MQLYIGLYLSRNRIISFINNFLVIPALEYTILSSQILIPLLNSQVQLSFLHPQKLLIRKSDIKIIVFLKPKSIIMYLVMDFILMPTKQKCLFDFYPL